MWKRKLRWVLGVTVVCLSVIGWYGAAHRPSVPLSVQTLRAEAMQICNSISVSGSVRAADSWAIVPEKPSVVGAVYVIEGQQIKKGQALFSIRTAADVGQVLPDITALYEMRQAEQTVVAAADTLICAPADGTVLYCPQSGVGITPLAPCAYLADLTHLSVCADVPELYVPEVRSGQRANVTSAAAPDEVYGAWVASVSPVAIQAVSLTGEQTAATVAVTLPLRDSDGLRVGNTVKVKIFTEQKADAITVPYEAVWQQGEQPCVWILKHGRAECRAVETGYLLENAIELSEGVQVGETIIMPQDDLTAGMAVEAMS